MFLLKASTTNAPLPPHYSAERNGDWNERIVRDGRGTMIPTCLLGTAL